VNDETIGGGPPNAKDSIGHPGKLLTTASVVLWIAIILLPLLVLFSQILYPAAAPGSIAAEDAMSQARFTVIMIVQSSAAS